MRKITVPQIALFITMFTLIILFGVATTYWLLGGLPIG